MRSFLSGMILLTLLTGSSALATVLAKVGNGVITLEEFKQRYNVIKIQAVSPPKPDVFLEDLIRESIGLQEAKKMKLENDPRVKLQLNEVLYRAYVELEIGDKLNKVKINEKEMRTFYKKYPEIRTSHILIEVKPNATAKQKAEAEKRAEEIYKEVKSSQRPFEELVKLYTDDPLGKTTGGDIGYQSRVDLVPSYYDAAVALKMNQVSSIVKTQYGFHIIKLTGLRSYQQANKMKLRAAVFDQKRRVLFNKLFQAKKRNYPISVNKKLLNAL